MPIIQRTAAAIGLALITLTTAPLATAHAAPNYGHVSGSGNPGRVVGANASSKKCDGGPLLLLRNSRSEPAAKRNSGPLGTFTVCVTDAAYRKHPIGSWFNNRSGTEGPVG